MPPKEKAYALVTIFSSYAHAWIGIAGKYKYAVDKLHENSKQCALIAVDEIIKLMDKVSTISGNYFRGTETGSYVDADIEEKYWQEVRKEIEQL